jgi:hypothetical protein
MEISVFTQLNPTIPLTVVSGSGPEGDCMAIAVIDYGPEHDLAWVVIMNDTLEVWCVRNKWVRGQANVTMGRNHALAIEPDELRRCAKSPSSARQDLLDMGVTVGRQQ